MSTASTHETSEALGLWEPKRTLTLEAARRHSRRVVQLRRVLFGLSALLVLVMVWQFVGQDRPDFPVDNPDEAVRMVNPRYSGRTEDGLPYYLTSSEAIRTVANDAEVRLIEPVLHFFREDGADESIVVAESGTYDDVNKVLNLYTEVDLTTDDGNRCETTHARIFTKTKIIEGDEPIHCEGDFGIVNGNAYEILENYTVYVFKNGMDAELDQSGTPAILPDDAGDNEGDTP